MTIYSMSANMPSFGPYERPAADGAAQDDLNVAAAAAAAAGAAAGAVLGAAAVSMAPDDAAVIPPPLVPTAPVAYEGEWQALVLI